MGLDMHRLGNRHEHYWLAMRMAKATDTDLVDAFARDALKQADWAEMVERCRACTWGEGCKRWLSDPQQVHCAAPAGCANQDRFAALATTNRSSKEG